MSTYLSTAELYDPAREPGAAPAACTARVRSHGDAAPLGQSAGGGRKQFNGYLSSAELYDPATGSWSSTGASAQHVLITRRRCCPQAKCWWRGIQQWFT